MKKIYLLGLAVCAGLFLASCQNKNDEPEQAKVADFEEVEVNDEGTNAKTEDGKYEWTSADYSFCTNVSNEGSFVSDFVVSAQQDNSFSGLSDAYHSACGGAKSGDKFAVVYVNGWGDAPVVSFSSRVIAGCYLTNNSYAKHSMESGDDYAKKFEAEDWFLLTIHGMKGDTETGKVDFYLAKDGNIVTNWTYCSLESLGEVDHLTFSLSSSDTGDYGMNTPAYFCIDDLGAAK